MFDSYRPTALWRHHSANMNSSSLVKCESSSHNEGCMPHMTDIPWGKISYASLLYFFTCEMWKTTTKSTGCNVTFMVVTLQLQMSVHFIKMNCIWKVSVMHIRKVEGKKHFQKVQTNTSKYVAYGCLPRDNTSLCNYNCKSFATSFSHL